MFISLVISGVVLFNSPAMAQTDEAVAREVTALAKAQWAAEIAGEVAIDQLANEYTEFNPLVPTRLYGKALNARLYEAYSSGSGNGK